MQLSRYIDLTHVSWTSSGPTVIEMDMEGAEGALFVGIPGTTVARTPTLDIYSGATSTGLVQCTTAISHASSAAGNYVVCTDVYKPKKRWLKASLASTAEQCHYLLGFKYGLRACLQSTQGFSSTDTTYLSAVTGGIVRAISPSSTGSG
jgi:hypothetical protein